MQSFPEIWGWDACYKACTEAAPKKKSSGDSCCSSEGYAGGCRLVDGKATSAGTEDWTAAVLFVDGKDPKGPEKKEEEKKKKAGGLSLVASLAAALGVYQLL